MRDGDGTMSTPFADPLLRGSRVDTPSAPPGEGVFVPVGALPSGPTFDGFSALDGPLVIDATRIEYAGAAFRRARQRWHSPLPDPDLDNNLKDTGASRDASVTWLSPADAGCPVLDTQRTLPWPTSASAESKKRPPLPLRPLLAGIVIALRTGSAWLRLGRHFGYALVFLDLESASTWCRNRYLHDLQVELNDIIEGFYLHSWAPRCNCYIAVPIDDLWTVTHKSCNSGPDPAF